MNARCRWLTRLALATVLAARAEGAGESDLPSAGFPADRYAALWTQSPFAIATPDSSAGSADYSLVGLAQFDGVSYASLVDRQTQEHFILASNKPVRNLTLVSLSHGPDGASAVIQHNGELMTLRLENAPPATVVAADPNGAPPLDTPRPFVGGPLSSVGGVEPPPGRHLPARFHRPPIIVPPRPH